VASFRKRIERLVEKAAAKQNRSLLRLLFNKHRVSDHILAIRNFLLLGAGELISRLLDLLKPELDKSAEDVQPFAVTAVLDGAIRMTNAQFLPADVLDRVEVRLMQRSPGDTGWEVFSLDYVVEPPLTVLFTPEVMDRYRRVFSLLWKVARVSHALAGCWQTHVWAAKMLRSVPQLQSKLQGIYFMRQEMHHLVGHIQSYFALEVCDGAFLQLFEGLRRCGDLDEVISLHSEFLSAVEEGTFILDHQTATAQAAANRSARLQQLRSGVEGALSPEDIERLAEEESISALSCLREVLDLCLRFDRLQEALFAEALSMAERRNREKAGSRRSKGVQGRGRQRGGEEVPDSPSMQLILSFSPHLMEELDLLREAFDNRLDLFMRIVAEAANTYKNDSLAALVARLDFNEFYAGSEDVFDEIQHATQAAAAAATAAAGGTPGLEESAEHRAMREAERDFRHSSIQPTIWERRGGGED